MGQFNIDDKNYFIVKNKTLQIIPEKWYIRCYKEKSEKDSVIINRDIIKIADISWRGGTHYNITYTKLSLFEGKCVMFQASINNIITRGDNLIYYLSGGVEFTLEELTEENTIGFIRGLLVELLGTTTSLKYINGLLSILKKEKANVDLGAVTVKNYLMQHERTFSSLKGKYLKLRENDRGCTKYFQIRDIRKTKYSNFIRVFYILLFSIEDNNNKVEYPSKQLYIKDESFFDSTIITKKEFNEARNNKKK